MRDSERKRTYDAEDAVARVLDLGDGSRFKLHGREILIQMEMKFGTVENVQTYVNAVLEIPSVRAAYPLAQVPIRVRHRKGATAAHYAACEIAVHVPTRAVVGNSFALRETVILHEIAHHLTQDAQCAHGPEFRAAVCFLVTLMLGPEIGWMQAVRYQEAGLRVA